MIDQQEEIANYVHELLLLSALMRKRSKYVADFVPKEVAKEAHKVTSTTNMAINTIMSKLTPDARRRYISDTTEEKLASIGNILRILQLCDESIVTEIEDLLLKHGKMVEVTT